MNPPKSLILFDLVGTLIEASGGPEGVGRNYARVAARYGVEVEPSALDRAFRMELQPLPTAELGAPRRAAAAAEERAHWQLIVNRVFARTGALEAFPQGTFPRFFDELFAHFGSADAWSAYPDVEPALCALEARAVRLGLVTNFDSRVFALLDSLGWASRFDPVVIPALAGASKPDPVIFRVALERAGAGAASAVYVGDLPEDDIAGSLGVGIQPVLIDRNGRHHDRPGVIRIGSLRELERHVQPW